MGADGLTQLLASPAAVALAAAFGAVWGSFLNVCIARIPLGQSVVRPGSHCFACGRPVRAADNIPVLSYFILRGRCRDCGARFSSRTALVEALTAALSAALFAEFAAAGDGPPAVRLARYILYFSFTAVLIVLSFIDLDTKRLPDAITLPSVPIFFLAAFAAHAVPWQQRAIGAAAGYLGIRIISDGYYHLFKREGMGLGDGKLLAVVGALLGWIGVVFALFCASFIGVLVTVPFLLAERRRRARAGGAADRTAPAPPADPPPEGGGGGAEPEGASLRHVQIPFGPFISLGAVIYLLFSGAVGRLLREYFLLG